MLTDTIITNIVMHIFILEINMVRDQTRGCQGKVGEGGDGLGIGD